MFPAFTVAFLVETPTMVDTLAWDQGVIGGPCRHAPRVSVGVSDPRGIWSVSDQGDRWEQDR